MRRCFMHRLFLSALTSKLENCSGDLFSLYFPPIFFPDLPGPPAASAATGGGEGVGPSHLLSPSRSQGHLAPNGNMKHWIPGVSSGGGGGKNNSNHGTLVRLFLQFNSNKLSRIDTDIILGPFSVKKTQTFRVNCQFTFVNLYTRTCS